MSIDKVIDEILNREGGYVNDPNDAGGETMYGITKQTARSNGYEGAMKDLPLSFARDVYYQRYVKAPGFEDILQISEAIGSELVDTGVNMGPSIAGKFLQRALNAFNNRGRDYEDLPVIGNVGPRTKKCLKAFLNKRGSEGERVMLAALNALQGSRYIELGEARQANETFMYGWFRTRIL